MYVTAIVVNRVRKFPAHDGGAISIVTAELNPVLAHLQFGLDVEVFFALGGSAPANSKAR